jgi:vacuolar-type H+-ATPase subunit E/Vma4
VKPLGSIAALVAAIGDDAAAEAEGITATADAAVARITADARNCPAPGGADDRVLSAARDRARIRIAQEDWHDARDAVAQREAWIQRVITAGTQQVHERQTTAETKRILTSLALEAIARLPSGRIEIVVADADAPLLDHSWRASVSPSGDATQVAITTAPIGGGCIARSADGRASFDNTYTARTERLQSKWRAELADFYERVTAPISASDAKAAS